MRISTVLDGSTGAGPEGGVVLARVGLAEIAARVAGLCRVAGGIVSKAALEVIGQLRLRLEEARGTSGRRKRMRVVESLALGGRRQLLLVRCDEQEYLVGTGPDSVETIVLRQPGSGAPMGGTETGAGQTVAAQAGLAQGGMAQAVTGRARSAGTRAMRAGTMVRERPEHGPWLVTTPCPDLADGAAVVKNRIREDESGQVRESWQ